MVLLQILAVLTEEVYSLSEEEKCRPKKIWIRKWIDRRSTRDSFVLLLKELLSEDPEE